MLKSESHLEAKITENLIKLIQNMIFCRKERQAHGHPWTSPRRGKKMGAAWRPWPGLPQAGLSGEKKWIPEKLESIFSPRRDIFCFPGEKKMDSYAGVEWGWISFCQSVGLTG